MSPILEMFELGQGTGPRMCSSSALAAAYPLAPWWTHSGRTRRAACRAVAAASAAWAHRREEVRRAEPGHPLRCLEPVVLDDDQGAIASDSKFLDRSLVDDLWHTLSEIDSKATLDFAVKNMPALMELKNFDRDEVWGEIEKRRSGDNAEDEDEDLSRPSGSSSLTRRTPSRRRLQAPRSRLTRIVLFSLRAVVLAERLREVVALTALRASIRQGSPTATGARPRSDR